jgi:ubiquinone/menaquinone biosynthesis C-methylase UbiE
LPSKILHAIRAKVLIDVIDRCIYWKARNLLSTNKKIMLNLPSHTIAENMHRWDNYDWSNRGEEWTAEVKMCKGLDPNQWKQLLINDMMLKYFKRGSTILEIGPGAGRWTEKLLLLAKKLILVDISQKCLDICQERFRTYSNIDYFLVERRLDFIDSASIDYIWSYDVFVHINPSDIEQYIRDFYRILRPGGCAIIHHTGQYPSDHLTRRISFRSYMNGDLFAHLITRYGMVLIEQNDTLPHVPYDLISVFTKPVRTHVDSIMV